MKITISGIVGSGKTTISKEISSKCDLALSSVGGLARKMALERGMHLSELTEEAKHDGGKIDRDLDEMQVEFGEKNDNFVIDSRLGFHFIPDSFKIFLKVSLEEASRRIFEDSRDEETYSDLDECLKALENRVSAEKIRYKKYYGLDFPNEDDFDLVVDTTNLSIEEVVSKILDSLPS